MLKEKCKVISSVSILLNTNVISYSHSIVMADGRRFKSIFKFNKTLLN